MRAVLVVAAEQDYFCRYCEHKMLLHQHVPGEPTPRDALTKDHVTPRVLGGPTTVENLVAACCQCNFMRGEIDAEAFANILEKWFRKDPFLWIRWHTIAWSDVLERKHHCMVVHERILRGRARRYREYAYRHQEYVYRAPQTVLRA
jgi:hypothetical protein